ncbi:MAG: endolytic transglycosylase MltG [Clostridia bacterium]|nr:endolytic transglycosylase MltG [Clostridia bacterium]MBQ2152829.1 endolytic transglycosylase MltG [Clostridia bacterium]
MSDELQQNDEQQRKRISGRKKKVENFNLNIDFSNSDDDMFLPDDTDRDILDVNIREDDDFVPPKRTTDIEFDEQAVDEEKQRRRALREEKRRKKQKAKKNGCVFRVVWLVMVLILGVFLAEFLLVGINDLLGRNRAEEEEKIIIQIPEDAGLDEVTDILYENGVISNASYFKLYAKITKHGYKYTPGSYEIKNNLDYEAIINYLQSNSNRVDTVSLQFTEGMTILEIADKLGENNVCNKEFFLELCNSDEFDEDFTFLANGRKNVSNTYYKLEGYLFPDTYEFYQGENAKTTIYRFLNNYEARLYFTKQRIEIKEDTDEYNYWYEEEQETDTDTRKKIKYEKLTVEEQAKKQGMTMDEVMILASMIQAEAADRDDMYKVSSVFHNRLDTLNTGGMTIFGENINGTLGSDPTIYYPYKKNTAPSNFKGTYNTYDIHGLPPGPICNPGMEAIKAALYPEASNNYYFCHKAATEDSDAKAYYAATIGDHNYNLYLAGLR